MTIDTEVRPELQLDLEDADVADELALPPIHLPIAPASGLYTWSATTAPPNLPPLPVPVIPPVPSPEAGLGTVDTEIDSTEIVEAIPVLPLFQHEELRLDVDGFFPQMTASGTSYSRFTRRQHWIASLRRIRGGWTGGIWYKDGTPPLAHTTVNIRVVRPTLVGHPSFAVVTFTGGALPLTRVYHWTSARFRAVEFEYDSTPDAHPVYAIRTHDHPNHPPILRNDRLTVDTVFRRAGFTVTNSGGNGTVPVTGQFDPVWSDNEMHDAMQQYWSRFANKPQWSMWVFNAALHDMGTGLGGIMFDDISPNHRQGTAVFTESFINNAPAGDPDPDAWVRRSKFHTTVHEMGHAFNLAHSWQKALETPWIALLNEPEARSFMNYPDLVVGEQQAFFRDFEYRFSDSELLFMRHAPSRFVQMGNAAWFDHHGFEAPEGAPQSAAFRLEVRANRQRPLFEFLEPVVLELKLANGGRDPKIVESTALKPETLVVIIKPEGKPARQWVPYAQRCLESRSVVLEPGAALYESLPVFAGINGWDVAEPGNYDIQVAAEVDGVITFSEPLRIRIAAPRTFDEEALAGDVFTEDVGRTLAFSGTAVLERANETLREVVERAPSSRAAIHAAVALAQPLVRDYKVLDIPDSESQLTSVAGARGAITSRGADAQEAVGLVASAVTGARADEAAESLGHVRYRREVEHFATEFANTGDSAEAGAIQSNLASVLDKRGVLSSVVREVNARATELEPNASKRTRKTTGGK